MSNNETSVLASALATIADYLTDLKMVTDKSTGEDKLINQMAFVQKRVMNGICFQVERNITDTKKGIEDAAKELQTALRQARGDELSQAKIDNKVAWIERLQMQETILQGLLAEAMQAYTDHTGEVYVTADEQVRLRKLAQNTLKSDPKLAAANRILASLGKTGTNEELSKFDSTRHSSDPSEQAA
jgi:hypothetical protein